MRGRRVPEYVGVKLDAKNAGGRYVAGGSGFTGKTQPFQNRCLADHRWGKPDGCLLQKLGFSRPELGAHRGDLHVVHIKKIHIGVNQDSNKQQGEKQHHDFRKLACPIHLL